MIKLYFIKGEKMNKKLIIREIKETDKNKITEMYKEYMNSELMPGIDRFEGIRNFEYLGNMDFKTWIEELEFNKKQEYKKKQPSKEKILITCKDFNIPSKKVIEKNGGKFENAYFNPEDQYTYLRFWVKL